MIDYTVGFLIDNIWSVCFLIAAFYNFYFRREYKPIIHMSLILSGIFGLSRIVYLQIILPQENLFEIYYLYWAGTIFLVSAWLVIDHHIKGFAFHWPIKMAIGLLLIEVVLHLAVHIDRNIVALNGSLSPNQNLDNGWWLWAVRNVFISLDNMLILASVLLPFKAFHSKDDIYKTRFSGMQMEKAFKRVDMLEDIIYIMPNGINKAHASQCLESARLLLTQWGGGGEDRSHLYCANVLCDRARVLALYVGNELETKLKNEADAIVKISS